MSAVIQPGRVPGKATAPVTASGTRLAVRRFRRNRLAVVGLGVVAFFFLFCFVGPLVYSTDQTHTLLDQVNLAPSGSHWLGTDAVGHDVLGRLHVRRQGVADRRPRRGRPRHRHRHPVGRRRRPTRAAGSTRS